MRTPDTSSDGALRFLRVTSQYATRQGNGKVETLVYSGHLLKQFAIHVTIDGAGYAGVSSSSS